MDLLEFQNVKKRFKKREILKNISFKVHDGEIFGVVGRSGGGKSTLLNIIIGMIRYNTGMILFEGKNALKKANYLRKKTGFATQENMLFDELTIRENSLYFGKLYSMRRRDIISRLNELIALLGLSGFEETPIKYLSGGMSKRANILVSLIHSPKLLILDEPTAGLDSILRSSLWNYIKKINKEGTTILVVSHLLDEIEKNCDRIAIISRGEVYALATVEQYKEAYGDRPFSEIFEELIKQQ